jgi:putative lipoprotein (rSAM/lipoprotein system)
MKVRFYRWYNAVLTVLLSMLGYGCSTSSEEDIEMYGVIVAEYGCPHADYIVKGQVTDELGTPVEGIKTSLKQVIKTDAGTITFGIDSIQTNETGDYQLKNIDWPQEDIKLIVEDIDGEANGGEFLSDTLDIDYDKAVKTKEGDGRWYEGVFEVTQDVKLKKKQ